MIVSTTARESCPVKILQNLNGEFSSNIQPIAKISGAGRASLLIQFADQVRKSDNPIVTVITIFHDRGNHALLCRLSQHLPHNLLVHALFFRQIAHPPGLSPNSG